MRTRASGVLSERPTTGLTAPLCQLDILVFMRSTRVGWQFHIVHQGTDEVCTLVFHFWPLPLCTVNISSHPWSNDYVSHASPGFLKGYFTVNKTSHVFSNLAIDKPHDQHNAGVKAVGLTECPATLQKWMFSGPDMARVLIEFERWVDRVLCRGPGVQKILLEDVMSLKSAIGEYGNPFLKPVATFSFSTHGKL